MFAGGRAVDDVLCVETSRATGTARFVTPAHGDEIPVASVLAGAKVEPIDFFHQYGAVFGVTAAARQLVETKRTTDDLGDTHTTFRQIHHGVPVFGARLRVHSDAFGGVRAVNGTFVPDLNIITQPNITERDAVRIAQTTVSKLHAWPEGLVAEVPELRVFRSNLARGIPGSDHLVYEVEVHGQGIREFVFVDAHEGFVVDRITGIHSGAPIHRVVYDVYYDPGFPIWEEGDALPYGDADVDNMIEYAEDTYNMVSSATNGLFRSWDGAGATMESVNDAAWLDCPNASWNGFSTNYCPGVTGDDTVAHEWGHAYTDATHNLIYQWQPGALNESYSDIFGEVVDLLNGSGLDAPGQARLNDTCSSVGGFPMPALQVTAPASIAGTYQAAGASFYPFAPFMEADLLEAADDGSIGAGTGTTTDACEPLIGFTPGRIALIDRGSCSFDLKAFHAQDAGAIAAVIVNLAADRVFTMGPGDPAQSVDIPTVMIGRSDGAEIRAELPSSVSASVSLSTPDDSSLRWLQGEDDSGFGGAIRDMWNPSCFRDPGKVSDRATYWCSTGDGGGVHTNSGIPNHAFALLADGGTYNGHVVPAIGLIKAWQIYWRAESVYQVPTTNFADHADSLEQSCADLVGVDLFALDTDSPLGSLSGEVITSDDCAALSQAVAAVELREDPTHCEFAPMLQPDAPPLCGGTAGSVRRVVMEDWESGVGDWSVGTRNVANPATFDTPDWAVVADLPDQREGLAAFVADPVIGDCASDTEAGVLFLESPVWQLPPGEDGAQLVFDHWVATEEGWDGGNVKVSVNGGAFEVVPPASFTFNAYPGALESSDNPLGGEWAFTGTDGGEIFGSWGQSQIDLTSLASAGDDVQIRFEMGLDGCNGVRGWYVDDVSLYYCCDTYGDAACDGILDMSDYADFSSCLFGPNETPSPAAPRSATDCLDMFNSDADVDIDLVDCARLQRSFDGPI